VLQQRFSYRTPSPGVKQRHLRAVTLVFIPRLLLLTLYSIRAVTGLHIVPTTNDMPTFLHKQAASRIPPVNDATSLSVYSVLSLDRAWRDLCAWLYTGSLRAGLPHTPLHRISRLSFLPLLFCLAVPYTVWWTTAYDVPSVVNG